MQKSFDYKGVSANYEITGQGEPVMLVHGFAEDGTIWRKQVDYLAKKFLLLIPDLPGSGTSGLNAAIKTIPEYADFLYALARNENLERLTLIGHSMGGYICLAFAEKYPSTLHALGLFHSTAFADSEEKINIRRKGIAFIELNGATAFIRQTTPNLFAEAFKKEYPEAVEEIINRYADFNPAALINYYEAMIARTDTTEVLRRFSRPVLFILGTEDNAVPLEQTLKLLSLPSLSSVHILPENGHMGMVEHTEESNRILESFLNFSTITKTDRSTV